MNDMSSAGCNVVASLTNTPSADGDELRVPGDLEVRADLVREVDPAFLRARTRGRLIYSLRSSSDGGAFSGGTAERGRRLLAASEHYDIVDLEAEHDMTPALLARIPPHRRRISWHGRANDLDALLAQFGRMARTPAQLYLLAPVARCAEQAMVPLQLLKHLHRPDVTAFGTAPAGVWSRLLAPWLGAPVVFGRVHGDGDSVPTVAQLLGDYRFPTLSSPRVIYAIVGPDPTSSMSPRLHNAAYRALGLSALFVPIPTDDFAVFWRETRCGLHDLGFSLGGVTVVSPYKETALRMGEMVSGMARRSGGANVLVHRAGGWLAHSTDALGVVGALIQARVSLAGRRAAVIGCGGAGRGAAAGLMSRGVETVLVNRGVERGRYASSVLGLPCISLNEFAPEDYSLIVHATPLSDELPFPIKRATSDTVIVDMRYSPRATALVLAARRRRLAVIDGWAVLSAEVARQFRMMTGRRMPMHAARAVLSLH